MFERHRPALRRQASRLLYNSGHDSDDVLQDVFLRVHTALRGGVVPLEPRAWLLRLVHNACVDELRRGRTRAVGDVELDGMPALTAQLPDELARRAEARALIGDIHRLPERQRHVLVMSALDGLTHEEVAGRLDTTVETTRSLLARARENLRRTAAARETACVSVCDALDEAAAAGVRASELARRHLWSLHATAARTSATCARPRAGCAGSRPGARGASSRSCWAAAAPRPCRRSPSAPAARSSASAARSPCRRSPSHSRHLPEITAAVPVPVAPEDASRPKRCGADQGCADPGGAGRDALDHDRVAHVATPGPSEAGKGTKAKAKRAPSRVGSAASRMKRLEYRRVSQAMREFFRKNPSMAERNEMFRLLREMHKQRPGSAGRLRALTQLHKRAKAQKFVAPPRKGITPAPPGPSGRDADADARAAEARADGRTGADAAGPDRDPGAGRDAGPDGDRRAGRDPGRHADAVVVASTPSSPRAPRLPRRPPCLR